jgi:hypothetical protein
MAKDSYTLIIVPNASSGLHKLQIPLTVLYGICLLLLIGFFSVVGLGFSYAQMALKTVDYNQLRTENTTLKVENKNLEIATRQLNTKIEGLEQLSDRIQEMMLADTWNQRFGLVDNDGVGGSMEDYPTRDLFTPESRLREPDRHRSRWRDHNPLRTSLSFRGVRGRSSRER